MAEDASDCSVPGDTCEVFAHLCNNTAYCEPERYRIDAIGDLPAAADGVIAAMKLRTIEGATSTRPALEGALDSAAAWASAHPGDKPVVVLATDGLPTTCDDSITIDPASGIPSLELLATSGAEQGISTFVIGVFAPDEAMVAEPNLDRVAQAGGTAGTFIVTTDGQVSSDLLGALDEVVDASDCAYTVEWVGDRALAEADIAVRVAGSSDVLARRQSRRDCRGGDGFYFELDPEQGGGVARIALCPNTCEAFATPPDSIEILVSCHP